MERRGEMHGPNYPGNPTLSALMCLAALWFAAGAFAQEEANPGRSDKTVWMLEAKGRVDVLRADRRRAARSNQPLLPAERVQTWTNSHASLMWYGRVAFQLSELSEITIPSPPRTDRRSTLEIIKGFLYFFHRGEPNEIEIQTPTAAAIVVGTEFSVRVEEDGRTVLQLFDGDVEISNAQGRARVTSGEQATVEPGQPPVVTPMVEATNDLIQWFLYYPGVLNMEEAGFTPAEEQVLAASLAAYRSGDLREALIAYPPESGLTSDAGRIYLAALLFTVGQVDKAETRLQATAATNDRTVALVAALRKLIATVKGQPDPTEPNPELATAWLVESYYRQSRGELVQSLAAATNAVTIAPEFGFGWERVAELEFSFGRTRPALAAVDRALKLSPRNAQALALRGFLSSAQSKIHEAIGYFDRAIALDGGLGNAWLGRGLCQIRRGAMQAGREDLMIAAAVEPQRSLLRSYLGKALSDSGDRTHAFHELELARRLDPKDPTALLYSALLKLQHNQINEAVRDLEASQALNDNRQLYRSRLLLDQDRAVRGANLASIFGDNGMTDVSVREATRAVNWDYANFSAHLFLANTFDQLRDPNVVNLRYETAWYSEYLVANLLAPVAAGVLSPTVSQQEYSPLFERNRLGVTSATEYRGTGDWYQSGAVYGLYDNSSALLQGNYLSENGQRPNNDQEQVALSLQLKQQITARDTLLLQPTYYKAHGGDLTQYYDPDMANPGVRFQETQEPNLLTGWHREWSPDQHTLLIAGRIQDTFSFLNPSEQLLVFERAGGNIVAVGATSATNNYVSDVTTVFTEAQHIMKLEHSTLVLGARYQHGTFDTSTQLSDSQSVVLTNAAIPFPNPIVIPNPVPASDAQVSSDFDRAGGYAYGLVQPWDSLLLTAGAAYDWVRYPVNFRYAPVSSAVQTADQISPKAGLLWQPHRQATVRAAYTRSLGGVGIDQSYRLDPSQVAGFNQSFRSLIPESVSGPVSVPSFDTFGAGLDFRNRSGLYLGLEAEWLHSEAEQTIGVEEVFRSTPASPGTYTISSTTQTLDFDEWNLVLTANQLLGPHWSLGMRYRLSDARLTRQLPDVPSDVAGNYLPTALQQEALLHQLRLQAVYNHPSGFFGRAQANWYVQDNRGDDAGLADANFWQFDVFAGWRFARRRVEVQLGILNLTDQDYRLNPLNLLPELPRERTFTASLRFNF